MRIVSLLPGATEIVCALGLEHQLVGISHECDFPSHITDLPKVTEDLFPANASSSEIDALVRERMKGERVLYLLNAEKLKALEPDLLITQTLCDVCAVSESDVRDVMCAMPGETRLVNMEPEDMDSVFGAITRVAEAADAVPAGERLTADLQNRIDAVAQRSTALEQSPRVLFLEWLDPPFCAGHWNPELVTLAGGLEVLGKAGERSRTLEWHEVTQSGAQVIVIACCGFDINRTAQDLELLDKIPGWSDLPAVKSGRIYLINGSHYFSRPGPRLVDSLEILAHALHPHIHPLPAGLEPAVAINDLKEETPQ